MSTWIIQPRDPLIFRDGKPFTGDPGGRARSLPFPYPSTLAGAVRRQAGVREGFDFNKPKEIKPEQIKWMKDIAMRGPILAEIDTDGQLKYYFPSPADALLVQEQSGKVIRHRLKPVDPGGSVRTDLENLKPVGPATHVKDKTYSEAPSFWTWEQVKTWLEGTPNHDNMPAGLGFSGPVREQRSHVSIQPNTQTSVEGALFQTSGLEFTRVNSNGSPLVLAVETGIQLREGADFLGGERRVVRWARSNSLLPDCPEGVRNGIVEKKHCRLILATPAHFEGGHLPKHLGEKSGLSVSVQGVTLARYQTISGWDYEFNKPKLTRRLVPAGSVYFLKFEGDPNEEQIKKFIAEVWLQPVSDDEQSSRDGFGLALLGTWDGGLYEMEVKP